MSTSLQALEAVLRNETELHASLLEAAEAKRNAIIDGDIDAMETVLKAEEQLIGLVEEAEVIRQDLVRSLQEELQIEQEPVKMSMILACIGEAGATLAKVHEELRAVLDKLRYRSRQNAELLKASMEHVNAFLHLVAQASANNASLYNKKGQRGAGNLGLLDHRA